MRLFDVNVLVNALRSDAPGHDAAMHAMRESRASVETYVILPEVAVGFMRVATRRGLWTHPEDSESVLAALDAWCSAPNVEVHEAGAGRWEVFEGLVRDHQLVGGDVHDGLLAAACLDFGATLMTSDRGFERFARLKVQYV